MARRPRRQFSAEFKADCVRLIRSGGRTIPQVVKEFDLTETALRGWLRLADIEAGNGPPDALVAAERTELAELRKRVKRLEMEREILKKAAAFFAKENA